MAAVDDVDQLIEQYQLALGKVLANQTEALRKAPRGLWREDGRSQLFWYHQLEEAEYRARP